MDAVILAGGLGTRIRNITKDKIPKSMLPIKGKPFLEYIIEYLKEYDVNRIILCTGFKREIIRDYFGSGKKYGVNIIYSEEETPLGTAGAIKKAEPMISGDKFLLLNGDTLFKINLKELIKFHKDKNAKITIALKYMDDTFRYGRVEINAQFRVTNFVEKGVKEPGYINGGVYVLNRTVLEVINEFPASFEKEVLPQFTQRRLYGKVFNDYFIDIGVPKDYERAKQELYI